MGNLKKNFLYNIGYQLLIIIIPLVTAPYISRVLGVDGIGTYSYIYSIAYYFGLFAMLGISNHGNRTIALTKKNKDEMSKKFWNLYAVQFICSTISLIIYVIFVLLFFKNNKIIAIIDISFILSYMFDITWLYFGLEQFKTTVLRNTFFKVLTLGLIFIFVKQSCDLWKYTLIMGGGTFLSQLYLWIPLKKNVNFAKFDFSEIKANIKPILFLFIPVLSYSIYKIMDKIMIGSLTTVSQVGLYENSEKIIGIPTSLITALGTVMMPRISSLLSEKKFGMVKKYRAFSFKYFTILSFGMIFGIISIGETLAPVYFGKAFIGCSSTIIILSISIIFLSWANIIRTQYLIPNKIDRPYIVSTIVGAIVNLIINILLIPRYGADGAAVGTVFAELTVFIVQMLYTRKEISIFSNIKCILYILPIGIIMIIIAKYIRSIFGITIKSLVLQIAISGMFYLILIFVIQLIFKDELLYEIIDKKKKKI